ncbi:hypothetical protein HDU98_006919 [Podochytrium sp. JEL0797]|nr:hypothetical protein HDU98_006919 [Podochytrium sp. JEL0797]
MKQLLRRISNIGHRSNVSTANPIFHQGIEEMLGKEANAKASCSPTLPKRKGTLAVATSSNASSTKTLASIELGAGDGKHVPVFLHKFVEYLSSKEALDMEGLFRVAAPVKQVKELRASMEKTGSMDFSKLDPYDGIHVVASVFKQWIRDIPEGVVPKKYFQPLLECGASAQKLHDVLQTLPKPNRDFLHHLMHYLLLLVSHSSRNLMTIQNIVIVFAPNVFKCPSAPSPTAPSGGNPEKYLVESMQVTKIMSNIMENFEEVFQTGDSKHKQGSRSSFGSRVSKTMLSQDEPTLVKLEPDVRSSASNRAIQSSKEKARSIKHDEEAEEEPVPPTPIPTAHQKQLIKEAIHETVATMLFKQPPKSLPAPIEAPTLPKRVRNSNEAGAVMTELKKKLAATEAQPEEIVKGLERVDNIQPHEILTSNPSASPQKSSIEKQTSEQSPLLTCVTKSRPKPPGRRPPAAPIDARFRHAMVFDAATPIDVIVLSSDPTPTIPIVALSGQEPEDYHAAPRISNSSIKQHGSSEAGMPKKKSVTFSNVDLSKRITPPPPPNKPVPSPPIHIVTPPTSQRVSSTKLATPSGANNDAMKEEARKMNLRVRKSTGDSLESAFNDGDDELSYSRDNRVECDNFSDDESHEQSHSKPINNLARKPINSIPSTSSSVQPQPAPPTSSLFSSPLDLERNLIMKLNPVIPSMTGPSSDTLASSRGYNSSPALDRIASPSSPSSISAQRRSSYRNRSTGSPRSPQKSALTPLNPLQNETATRGGESSSRTLAGGYCKSDGIAAHDLPSDVLNSPYLSNRKKRVVSKEKHPHQEHSHGHGRMMNASLMERALKHNDKRNMGSSLDSARKAVSTESFKASNLLNDKDSRKLIEEEFRALKSKVKLLKSTGAEIHKADRLRYKHLSGLIKDVQREEMSDSSSLAITDHHEGTSQSTLQISANSSLERLARKRLRERRPKEIQDMTVEQMMEEKTAVKRELAHLKALFKESSNSYTQDDKNIMRELYARYCEIKSCVESRTEDSPTADAPSAAARGEPTDSHESMSEMEQYALLRHEKKMLQLHLHSFQDAFVKSNGRRVKTAEDRAPVQAEYKRYKELRTVIDEMEGRLKMDSFDEGDF